MTGAVEKQKLVYILNRDAQARLTISSPLEAHKSNTLVYHMIGVDVGFENPTFACLEIDYEVSDNICSLQCLMSCWYRISECLLDREIKNG
jgi:splicing factor 3B subunit 3